MERMEHAPAARTTLQPSTTRRNSVWSSVSSSTHGLLHRRRQTPAEIRPSEARNREAAVRIADLKAELMQLDCLIADAAAKQNATQDKLAEVRRDSVASSATTLPEVLYPPFNFDGEFEGTFGQPRRGIMSELMAMCDTSYWNSWETTFDEKGGFSPHTPPDSPQLTQDNGSFASTLSTPHRSDLGITGLYAFPSPPTRVFEGACHQRDSSDASGITIASNSTTMHECATILQATPVLLPRKSPNPAVIQISPPGRREPFDVPDRRSELQLRRSAGLWTFDPPTTSTPENTDAKQGSSRPEPQPAPRQKEQRRSSLRRPNQITTAPTVAIHKPTIADQRSVDHLPSHRASYSWIPARASSLYHDLQKVRPAEPESEMDQAATIQKSSNSHDQALLKPRRPRRVRRLNRIPKGRDRLPAIPTFGRRVPSPSVWLRRLPLSPRWRKARNSILTDLGTLGSDTMPSRGSTGPAPSNSVPRNRASADFRFERTLMAGLETSNLSSSGSMTTLSLRTVRAIRRLSHTSTVSSKPSSAPRSINTGADFPPHSEGKAAGRHLPQKSIRASQHGVPLASTQPTQRLLGPYSFQQPVVS